MRKTIYALGLVILSVVIYYYSINNQTIDLKNHIKGIDISKYQNNINWDNINTSEVKFVIIKSSEGSDLKDPKFKYNWNECNKRKIITGAFHVFSLASSGKSQAANFISMVPKNNNTIPPAIDINVITSSKQDNINIINELKNLERELFRFYGKKPIFYTDESTYDDFLVKNFKSNNVWIRDYDKYIPNILISKKGIWQYKIGKCKGIKGEVDLDIFNGDIATFKKFIQ